MRHLDRELKRMQNFIAEKKIKLMHMPTQNQTVDMMTKSFTPAIFLHLKTDISSDSYTQTRRSLFRRRTSSIASQSLSRRRYCTSYARRSVSAILDQKEHSSLLHYNLHYESKSTLIEHTST
jgi:hypothetical protein